MIIDYQRCVIAARCLCSAVIGWFLGQQGPLLLTWININCSMDKWSQIQYSVRWNSFPNFNGSTVEVWEWVTNFTSHFGASGNLLFSPFYSGSFDDSLVVRWLRSGSRDGCCGVGSCGDFRRGLHRCWYSGRLVRSRHDVGICCCQWWRRSGWERSGRGTVYW